MNYLTEDALFAIKMAIVRIADTTLDNAQRIIAPIKWWVVTGRCPGRYVMQLNHLTKRQVTTIAKRLIPMGGFDYDTAIASVMGYLDRVARLP